MKPKIKTQSKNPEINRPTFIKQALEVALQSLPNLQNQSPTRQTPSTMQKDKSNTKPNRGSRPKGCTRENKRCSKKSNGVQLERPMDRHG